MTSLQKQIRALVLKDGYAFIKVGVGSPANMSTIKSLQRSGYKCKRTGIENHADVWLIEHPAI